MIGAGHSHDPEFPDDAWNLYSMLDREGTTALNATIPEHAVGIFKPHAHRLNEHPEIISDADAEIIVVARFTSPVHIRKIMVIGGGDGLQHPASLQCFVNNEDVDFTNVGSLRPAQTFSLPMNEEGVIEHITALQPFSNVTCIAFYFPENYGHEATVLRYIGLQGDHTHYRREAVDTVYELLCNGQDIAQPEDQLGAHAHHMH